MEKLIKAVQESKRNQSGIGKKQVISDSVLNEPNLIKNDDVAFEYSQTRVVTLNGEHLAKNRIVSFNKNNHLSLGFDILRTQIVDKMLKNGWRTMAITSPIADCGKTMVAINLAMSIAHHTDKTAMLVDFDLRRPSISKYLGLPSNTSLNDVLAGDAEITEALVTG